MVCSLCKKYSALLCTFIAFFNLFRILTQDRKNSKYFFFQDKRAKCPTHTLLFSPTRSTSSTLLRPPMHFCHIAPARKSALRHSAFSHICNDKQTTFRNSVLFSLKSSKFSFSVVFIFPNILECFFLIILKNRHLNRLPFMLLQKLKKDSLSDALIYG